MQTIEEMASFVVLWDLVQEVQLGDGPDLISWKWTTDGTYSTKSAYNAQLIGSYSSTRGESVCGQQKRRENTIFCLATTTMQNLNSRQTIG